MQIGLTPCTVDEEVIIPHKPKTEVFESQILSGGTRKSLRFKHFRCGTLPVRHTSGATPNGISCRNSVCALNDYIY